MKKALLVLAILLLSTSGHAECPRADANGDCKVNLEDLAIMASEWMTEGIQDMAVFVDIPGGTFRMGDSFDPEGDTAELPVHTVTLSSFRMSKCEITNGQFCDFLNSAYPAQIKEVGGIIYASSDTFNDFPYCDMHSYDSSSQIDYSSGVFTVRSKVGRSMINDPVVKVSWFGAKAFCDYYDYYRLPTEAEWEYAARGGLTGNRFPWGNTINHNYANYRANGLRSIYDTSPYTTLTYHPTWNDGIFPYTSPVETFTANGYGLHDMASNVWEWCSDRYSSSYYSSSPSTNPTGPATGNYRVLRGGGWSSDANSCRVAYRGLNSPYVRYDVIGFRVCLDLN